MKLKNKKLLSILLGLEMTISFAGCEGLKDYNTSQNDTTYHTSQNSTTYSSTSQYTTYKAPVSETTTEEKEEPFVEDEAYVCALANLNLRKAPNLSSEVLEVIPKFSKLRKEKTNGTFDYISYDGTYGYVSHKYIEKLTNPYVEVDISDQTLRLYEDGDVKLEADVVTGKKAKYDTRLGCHKIYSKEKGRYLTGSNYKVWVDFWMPFDRGQGLHDASWRKTFNKDDYLNGSHGCVNMKYTDAEEVYNEVSVGTNVLVHE